MELTRIRRGWYDGTDAQGTDWRVVQETSSRWSVFESRRGEHCYEHIFSADSLGEARRYIYGEVRERTDPEYAERMRLQRQRRHAIKRPGECLAPGAWAKGD